MYRTCFGPWATQIPHVHVHDIHDSHSRVKIWYDEHHETMIVIWGVRKPCNSVLVNDPIHFNKGGTKHWTYIHCEAVFRPDPNHHVYYLIVENTRTNNNKNKKRSKLNIAPWPIFFWGWENDWKVTEILLWLLILHLHHLDQQLRRCHVQETQRLARQRRLELRNLVRWKMKESRPEKRNVLSGNVICSNHWVFRKHVSSQKK